ncbi:hypothetical protein F5X99DRAFT_410255 [Biscogniauxia marginata]|nr:hypothetical protein F5X99DRAFT_410255 [Biscogniauxia marginata]
MKLQAVVLLIFTQTAFGWWNCETARGGDYGTCLENGNWNNAMACTSTNPCQSTGNGCSPLGSGLASCS